MQYIGIDLAKSSFVSAFPQDKGYVTTTYRNDPNGISTFLAQLDKAPHHCVLEATGNYGALLLQMLIEAEIAVSVLNPKQIKHFACMMLSVTKTDMVAKMVVYYFYKFCKIDYQSKKYNLIPNARY